MEDDDEDDDIEEDEDKDANGTDEMENNKVEDDDVAKEEIDNVEEEGRSQDCDPHFVRACAIEMHFITCHKSIQKSLCVRI